MEDGFPLFSMPDSSDELQDQLEYAAGHSSGVEAGETHAKKDHLQAMRNRNELSPGFFTALIEGGGVEGDARFDAFWEENYYHIDSTDVVRYDESELKEALEEAFEAGFSQSTSISEFSTMSSKRLPIFFKPVAAALAQARLQRGRLPLARAQSVRRT